MNFVTFDVNGDQYVGMMTQDKQSVISLREAEKHYLGTEQLPRTMLDLIAREAEVMGTVADVCQRAENDPNSPARISVEKLRILAPIPRPTKNIFCIGKNYREHVFEFDKTRDENAIPKYPIVFSKPPTAVNHPDAVVKCHTNEMDYEVELAVVIGKKGSAIPKEAAYDHVFGYTIINDVTARDLQKRHGQWLMGKGLDTTAPMGPYLVHKSSVPNVNDLAVELKVNGEVRQQSNTNMMMFDIPTIIATISSGITLEPGDIIATGTPAGVGAGFSPPKFLKPGDEMELTITHLGTLKNTIR